ncbi:hypothetical protein GCM10011504_03600 [Siccirubricoccus deserti]|uniref:Transposase n=1 Tax=Siccirubricoccus deserti TaxID=2013562 RepID=A0A9X0UBD2_9PROT|nr:transposase [Siccirubricoccus deserti]MBC4013689.1 transposase [Siccirubricoccus deserti]GGC28697.1 hypothetical protein GCM10011504_03600 [Siccirubricoccus deserti]
MNRADFVFGNARLAEELANDLALAEEEATRTGKPARRFRDFHWSTLDSWSRRRRVIGKAEQTRGEANRRLIVTSLRPGEPDSAESTSPATLRPEPPRRSRSTFARHAGPPAQLDRLRPTVAGVNPTPS